jgi:hypothetical protein
MNDATNVKNGFAFLKQVRQDHEVTFHTICENEFPCTHTE